MELVIETDMAQVRVKMMKSIEEVGKAIPDAMAQIAEFGLSRWTDVVQERLRGDSAQEYLTNTGAYYRTRGGLGDNANAGLIDKVVMKKGTKEGSAQLALIGKLSNMLENGFDAFDIAAAVRKKQGKNDVNVPFRHFLPSRQKVEETTKVTGARKKAGIETRGRHRRPTMSQRTRNRMQASIAKAESAGRKTARGQKYPAKRGSGHRTGIFSGMTAPTKAGGRSQGTGHYNTFRRITSESVWIHPGFQGIKAVEEVQKLVETVGPQMLGEFLGTILEVKLRNV